MNNLQILKLFLRISWKISPAYFAGLLIQTVADSGQLILNIILPKYLIDELIGPLRKEYLLLFAALIIASNFFFTLLRNLIKRYMDEKNLYMKDKLNEVMSQKIMKVDYSYLENPHYLDLKERAKFAVTNQDSIYQLVTSLAAVLKNAFTVVGLAAVMLSLGMSFLVLILFSVVLMLIVQKRFLKYELKTQNMVIPLNREFGYYVGLAYDELLQKDIRLYGMQDMIIGHITEYNKKILDSFQTLSKKRGISQGIFSIINSFQSAAAYGYAGIRVVTNWFGPKISIGSFTMYANATIQFSVSITELGSNIMDINQYIRYLQPFMEFMALPDEDRQTEDGQPGNAGIAFSGPVDSIRFEHVSFCYPGSTHKVLDDISFEILRGEKISIVGLNGAGKSTLVKLLSRLYPPTEGAIFINGKNIADYAYSSYTKEIAAVFQDYRLFHYTIEENVTCMDAGRDPAGAQAVLEEAGLKEKLQSLPDGVNTLLGKSYDTKGIELSGGQSQKIAIARALYKKASLIMMDEPTSALDPIAEAEIYENFNRLAGDKTAIYISHRMSSSTFCDKVLVLEHGRIADFAPHKKLMEKEDSLYYKLFHSQAVNYQY